jgi:hypothetical protein
MAGTAEPGREGEPTFLRLGTTRIATSRRATPTRISFPICRSAVKVELYGATAKVNGWGNEDLLADIKVNTDAMARTTQLVQQEFVKITE